MIPNLFQFSYDRRVISASGGNNKAFGRVFGQRGNFCLDSPPLKKNLNWNQRRSMDNGHAYEGAYYWDGWEGKQNILRVPMTMQGVVGGEVHSTEELV